MLNRARISGCYLTAIDMERNISFRAGKYTCLEPRGLDAGNKKILISLGRI